MCIANKSRYLRNTLYIFNVSIFSLFLAFLQKNPNDSKRLTTTYWSCMEDEGELVKIKTEGNHSSKANIFRKYVENVYTISYEINLINSMVEVFYIFIIFGVIY